MEAYRQELIKKSTGTTFKAVTKNVISDIIFPLPPLQEQYRIVEKIEETLLQIDKLRGI